MKPTNLNIAIGFAIFIASGGILMITLTAHMLMKGKLSPNVLLITSNAIGFALGLLLMWTMEWGKHFGSIHHVWIVGICTLISFAAMLFLRWKGELP